VNRQQHLAATDAIGCHSEPRQAAITSQDSNPVRDNMRMERVGGKGSNRPKNQSCFIHISYLSPNTSIILVPVQFLWVRSSQTLGALCPLVPPKHTCHRNTKHK
ncbi:hypothetical protein HOY82DRAFT_483684, partial [Tuber indicum]